MVDYHPGLNGHLPINRFAHGGTELILPIDRHIPLYPPFVVPYLLASLLFVGLPVWAAFKVKSGEFAAYTISILFATWISFIVYLAYPTFVTRPEIVSKDIFSHALSILYQADQAYNAAPSGHTFYGLLSFTYLSLWKPRYRLLWAACVMVILASTLFTHQHHVLDLVSGFALAAVAFLIGYLTKKIGGFFVSNIVVLETYNSTPPQAIGYGNAPWMLDVVI